MNRPTDDELEAMAARLDKGDPFGGVMQRAAAMLRACKGRGRVKPLEWEQARDGAGWHPQLTIAYCPVFDKRFYAEHPEKQARIDAAREARILAALEPAPDHAEWNAAIEAAANVAQSADTPVFKDGWTSGQDAAAISAMQSIAAAIRQLKKGQTDD